jgi:hypothetical protein
MDKLQKIYPNKMITKNNKYNNSNLILVSLMKSKKNKWLLKWLKPINSKISVYLEAIWEKLNTINNF